MPTYVALLRGINVGGKNKVSMKALKTCLEDLGYMDIATYIASGNVVLKSGKGARTIAAEIEKALPKAFKLDADLLRVHVLSGTQFKSITKNRPKGFGDAPGKYHSDAIFLMDVTAAKAKGIFTPREGVDELWQGRGVIYHQRLSAQRTKSRLNRIMSDPIYKAMTIRSWQTVEKLAEMLEG